MSTTTDSIPALPDAAELPIPSGEAQQTMLAALKNLTVAVLQVERLAMACARGLDSASTGGGQ